MRRGRREGEREGLNNKWAVFSIGRLQVNKIQRDKTDLVLEGEGQARRG